MVQALHREYFGGISPPLFRLLLATLLLSGIAVWWPQAEAPASIEAAPVPPVMERAPAGSWVYSAGPASAVRLPSALPVQSFERARFDPFVGAAIAASVRAAHKTNIAASASLLPPLPAIVAAPAPVVVAQVPAVSAPAPSFRFLGRMVDPSGQVLVYLIKGNDPPIAVAAGTRLDDGYVVESIGVDMLLLHYPALNTHAAIPVPPLPKDSIVK